MSIDKISSRLISYTIWLKTKIELQEKPYKTQLFGGLQLINAIFEPFEQVSQMQAQLLDASFGLMTGGPAQAHVGIGGGGSSSDMPWGEKNKHVGRRR